MSPNVSGVLLHLFAAVFVFATFERIYNLIFGNQISLLQALNANALRKEDVKSFYDNAKSKNPHFYSNYSFEQWLGFMASQVLIGVSNDTVAITVRGREFLKYLIQESLLLSKMGMI